MNHFLEIRLEQAVGSKIRSANKVSKKKKLHFAVPRRNCLKIHRSTSQLRIMSPRDFLSSTNKIRIFLNYSSTTIEMKTLLSYYETQKNCSRCTVSWKLKLAINSLKKRIFTHFQTRLANWNMGKKKLCFLVWTFLKCHQIRLFF